MRRRWLVILLILAPIVGYWLHLRRSFPSDQTPLGAYLRIVIAVNQGNPASFFAYTETQAQHACYTIHDYRKKSVEQIRASYPEPEKGHALAMYQAFADAPAKSRFHHSG